MSFLKTQKKSKSCSRNEIKLKPNRLIDWKKVSILSCCCCCCCLILLLLGEFRLNTQYLLLEVNWLGIFCLFVILFVLFSILFISASACSCVLWHGGFYILCLLFVIVCLLVAVLNMETKQNLLNICLCMYLWRVFVEKGKMLLWQTKDQTKAEKLQMLNTTSSFVSVYSELYTLLLFCFRPMLLSLSLSVSACVLYKGCLFVWVLCTLSFCFSLHLHIMICVCLLASEEESFLTILFVFVFCMFLNKYSL